MRQNLTREQIKSIRTHHEHCSSSSNANEPCETVVALCDLALQALDRQEASNAELNKHYILGWNDALYSAGELFSTGARYQYTRPQAARLCNSQRRPLPSPPSDQGSAER